MIILTLTEAYSVKRPVDDKLILKISTGDTVAFRELYDSTSASVYGFVLSILKNSHDADDVLQETFLKVWSAAAEYKPQGKPMAWMFTIARNLSLIRLREAAKCAPLDENIAAEIDFSLVRDSEQRMILKELFSLLTDEEKQIIMLHAAGGLKHREIAAVLGVPTGTVLSKYSRAIKRLKAVAEEENLDD